MHGLFTPLHTSTVDFAIAPKTPSFPAQSYTQLLPAALQEAKLATHAHLDTLRTSLALLDALDGFSATVAVLREEFEEKVKTCEERLEMIGDVEGMVGDRMVEEWEGYMVK